MAHSRKPKNSSPDNTFSNARTWMKPSTGRRKSRRPAREDEGCVEIRPSHRHFEIPGISPATAGVEAVFREESGRIIATLIGFCGSFDLAEEAMQEAFTSALAAWPLRGVPRKPRAW